MHPCSRKVLILLRFYLLCQAQTSAFKWETEPLGFVACFSDLLDEELVAERLSTAEKEHKEDVQVFG